MHFNILDLAFDTVSKLHYFGQQNGLAFIVLVAVTGNFIFLPQFNAIVGSTVDDAD